MILYIWPRVPNETKGTINLKQNQFQMQVVVIEAIGEKTGNAITFNRRLCIHQIDSVYGLVLLVPCKPTNR